MKTFAFKLSKKNEATATGKWKARDGIIAGCTDPNRTGDFRDDYDIWGNYRGRDNGYWC
jgi:hypothetical protein